MDPVTNEVNAAAVPSSSDHGSRLHVSPDVVRFIAAFPSLTLMEATDASSSQSHKIHCSLTGHEMPCRIAEVEKYTQGKKYKKALERSDQQFEKYKPHIVPSNKKRRMHQLFCTLTSRHINRLPADVERHVNGRRYKKALLRYEECQRQGIQFKPLGRSWKRDEGSDGEKAKQYSHSAFSDTSESEAESEDSMSDLYPRECFERLSPDNQEEEAVGEDSGSDFDVEDMDVGSQATSNRASTSAAGEGASKRKKNFQKGGKRKFVKQQRQDQTSQSQKAVVKKGAHKQMRKGNAT